MILQTSLYIAISIGIVLVFSKKYTRAGLAIVGFSCAIGAVLAYSILEDTVQSVLYTIAALSVLYGLVQTKRGHTFTKNAQVITGGFLVALGLMLLLVGTLSPLLFAGIAVIIMASLKHRP